MTSDLIFYTNPMSRGRVIRWMLEEVGCGYETVILDYDTTMKAPAYLAVNPMGKVPAIMHKGRVVTECGAICAYLADAFPETGLTPDAAERADYYRWLFFAAGPLEQAVTNHTAGFEPDPKQQRMFGYGNFDLTIDALEKAVTRYAFIAGDRFSAADVYVGAQIAFGLRFGTVPARDGLRAYTEKLTSREAYVRAASLDDALLPSPTSGAS